VIAFAGCGDSVCPPPPCPDNPALELTVSSNGTAPVPGLSVTASGPLGSATCQWVGPSTGPSICIAYGPPGTYQVVVSAPGFQSVQQTLQVTSTGKDGCDTCELVQTRHLDITLAPAAAE